LRPPSYLGQHPGTDAVVYAGCQDNGTIRYWGEPAWFEAPQGDGGGIAVDPRDPRRVMRQYINASLSISLDGGLTAGSWKPVPFPPGANRTDADRWENANTRFYSPIRAVAAGTSTLAAFGTYRLWVTEDWGTTWVTLPTNSDPLSGATPDLQQDSLGGSIVDIRFASASLVFVATSTTVYKIEKQNNAWTKTQLGGASGITAIDIEDASRNTLYAVLGGSGGDHAWYYDAAATPNWQSAGLSKGVLDSPVHAIAIDPNNKNNVYIGADIGVWKGIKTGANTWTWDIFSLGLPEAAVLDLAVHPSGHLLRAGTHGRGVWEIPLWTDTASKKDPDLYVRANYADSGRLYNSQRYSWIDNTADPTAPSFNVNRLLSADVKLVRTALLTPNVEVDFTSYAGLPSSLIAADLSDTNRVTVQIHNRGHTSVPSNQVKVLLLFADAANGPPDLPQDYAARILAGDTTNWLPSSGWKFADSANPFRTPSHDVTAAAPQVVSYDVNPSSLGLSGAKTCALAFVTATACPLPTTPGGSGGTEIKIETLVLKNPQVAARTLVRPTWKTVDSLPGSGGGGNGPMILLPDGRALLFAMYIDVQRTLFFHPDSGTWTQGATPPIMQYRGASSLLPNGKILLSGGSNENGIHNLVRIYDPIADSWSDAHPMALARRWHFSTPLPNGRVLVMGGAADYSAPEIYDPQTDRWSSASAGPQLKYYTGWGPYYAALANGSVLMVADTSTLTNPQDPTSSNNQMSSQIFDFASGQWGPIAKYSSTISGRRSRN